MHGRTACGIGRMDHQLSVPRDVRRSSTQAKSHLAQHLKQSPEQNSPASEDDLPPPENLGLSERSIGVFALVGSLVFIYLGMVSPIWDAMNGAPTVTISTSSAIFAPMVLALGITYTILGENSERYLGRRDRPSIGGWVFYILTFVLGLIGYQVVRAVIRGYGYDV